MWFFGRKKEDLSTKELSNRVDVIEKSLKLSFSNIKDDLSKVNNRVDKQQILMNRLLEKLENLESSSNIETSNQFYKEYDLNLSEKETKILENLTEAQRKLLFNLIAIQNESSEDWISIKYLTQETYPNKSSSTIRSTVSKFIKDLTSLGLIEKKRKGRELFVSAVNKDINIPIQKIIKHKYKK
jgi:superfamily II DNA helicase RecQ